MNTAYIFLSKLKKWIGGLEPQQGVEGLAELKKLNKNKKRELH